MKGLASCSAGFLAVVVSAAASLAAAQEQASQTIFGESVDVRRINVEVWVSDGSGRPVTGLSPDVFEVREDGKQVEIANFSEIRIPPRERSPRPQGQRTDEATVVSEPAAPAADSTEPPAESAATPEVGWLAFYFDELFSRPEGRQQMVDDLREALAFGRVPAERILLLRQREGLEVVANLGSSREQLEQALRMLEETSSRGVQTFAAEREALRSLQQEWERENVVNANGFRDPCDFYPQRAYGVIQAYMETTRIRVSETLDQLTTAVEVLAGLPGPKVLVYAADALPLSPGRDLLTYVKSLCEGRQDDRRLDYLDGMDETFRRLSRYANAGRVTLYTVQASGLGAHLGSHSADTRGTNGTVRALSRYSTQNRMESRAGMSYLADQTGGRTIFNRNEFVQEFAEIADDLRSHYSLAYVPTHDGDGLEHSIEVKVRDRAGRRLQVRHRPGYRDKSDDQRLVERLQSALYLNLVDNPLDVRLAAGEIGKARKKRLKLPLLARVPVDNVLFLPESAGEYAGLEVAVMSRQQGGKESVLKRERYRLPRPQERSEGLSLSLAIELLLDPGIHTLAVAVRDQAARTTSIVATAVELQP